MTKKQITPTNPDEIVKVEDAEDATADRKTMGSRFIRKTMNKNWARRSMNKSWLRRTMRGTHTA